MILIFRDCLVHDHLKKMYVTLHKQHFKSILGVESDQIDEFDKKYILMFKIDEEELSDEEEEEEEEKKEMHFVENEQLVDILNEAYPKIRGKLNLSRLVFCCLNIPVNCKVFCTF